MPNVNTNPIVPTLLTASQVAQRIGRSSATVRRLAETGDLPAAARLPGPNGPVLFLEADVERYLAARAA